MDKRIVELWLGLCDRDLKGAQGMLQTKNYILAGYQCHQVVEKALKACIASVSEDDPPKIHNLPKLAAIAGLNGELSPDQIELINRLDPLFIEAKYSDYKTAILSQLTPEYCKQLISKTEEFLSWIKNKLSK
ncbi:MAG: HEPN domain-containing protein [Chitinispirillia bacterium]|nr:HEPN domain-containing protein [Chitinispirillia bacterium]